jgi:demethylmenaquinone methyltransferase/2-methoxy-6-polyprenyl-1,4-benzoquinol methylase
MNRIISAGQDLRWRRLALLAAGLQPGDVLLDVATGTGDMAYLAKTMVPNLRVVGVDFTTGMMRVGQKRSDSLAQMANSTTSNGRSQDWVAADTYTLPFPGNRFDAVVSAFLLRNLSDPLAGLCEQVRVLKPGGRLVMLDATPPPKSWLQPFIFLHLELVIPALGRLISDRPEAYRYFPESVANFLPPQAISQLFERAGLQEVYHRSFLFGIASMVAGRKSINQQISKSANVRICKFANVQICKSTNSG